MKYPYITRCEMALNGAGADLFVLSDNKAVTARSSKVIVGNYSNRINITTEYLNNTYGKVESPEHAEFIIKLCEKHGIAVKFVGDDAPLSFEVICGQIRFHSIPFDVFASNWESKQITIPMPPKKQDWLKPGCKVMSRGSEFYYICKSPFDDTALISLASSDGWDVISVPHSELSKPKTEDEILAEELISKYKHLPKAEQAHAIAKDIINNAIAKYSITKKPQ